MFTGCSNETDGNFSVSHVASFDRWGDEQDDRLHDDEHVGRGVDVVSSVSVSPVVYLYLISMAGNTREADDHRRGLTSDNSTLSVPCRVLDLLPTKKLSFVAFSLAFAPRGHPLAQEAKNMVLEASKNQSLP